MFWYQIMIWTHAAGNRFISFILCHKRDCMHFTATPGETWLYMFMYIIFLQLWCWKLNSIYFLFIAKYLALYVYYYLSLLAVFLNVQMISKFEVMAWTEQCNKIYWIHHFTAGDKICQKYCNTICTCHYLLLERPLPAISCQCKLQYCFCPFLCECPNLFLLAVQIMN